MEQTQPKRSHHKKKPDLIPQLPDDPLDRLVAICKGDLSEALKLLFWTQRFENPDFTFQVHPKDVKGFNDCIEYLEVHPEIRVFRPGGMPAQEMIPAHGQRRAVPGRAAIPPKDYIVIQMVDVKGDAFKPVENNQADRDHQIKADAARRARDQAVVIANQLANDIASGTFSNSTIADAVVALRTLAGVR